MSRSRFGPSLDHFLFVCNFPLAAYLEECLGPNLILEVDAILSMVFIIFMGAYPLVVYVGKLLFQIRPVFIAFFHGILSDGQRRNGH